MRTPALSLVLLSSLVLLAPACTDDGGSDEGSGTEESGDGDSGDG